jgi:hypothetical protein
VLDELEKLSERRHVSPYSVANVHIGLGDKEQAFAWLERAYREHSHFLALIKIDPRLDSLHCDPRFDDLLERIGLAH